MPTHQENNQHNNINQIQDDDGEDSSNQEPDNQIVEELSVTKKTVLPATNEVAIIGMSGRFPGARNFAAFSGYFH